MKRISVAKFVALALLASTAMSCQWQAVQPIPEEPPAPPAPPEQKPESDVYKKLDAASHISYDETTNTYTVDGTKANSSWNYAAVPLNKYGDAKIKLEFSCIMEVENKGDAANLMWQVTQNGQYPIIVSNNFASGNSGKVNVSATKELNVDKNSVFYLSTYNTTKENLNIKISDFTLKVTVLQAEEPINFGELKNWKDVPSLKDAYLSKGFDSFGFAVENFQLTNSEVQSLLRKHANTITMGNEYKFDSVFGTYHVTPNTDGKFKASSGIETEVPTNCPDFTTVDSILENCKKNGLKMRGHVLVWHSQTSTKFFREGYTTNGAYVSKEVMDARQEWYIKTVLEHITEWEQKNNGGKHIIWAWDVVNEAMADDANVSEGKYLRGSTSGSANSSDWYKVYQSDEYILNAFKYANKYAPNDVLLCYNDYNSYMENKTEAICKTVDRIRETEGARIDVVGMQSHVIDNFPGAEAFGKAIKTFAAKDVDIHVTEFDLANKQQEKYSIEWNTKLYESYFKTMVDNMKTDGKRGVTSITIWGLDDQSSWLNNQYKRDTYPLLFRKVGNSYSAKQEFYNVLNAAK